MSLTRQLRSLFVEANGDMIKTNNGFAEYIDTIGWVSAGENTLDSLDVDKSYQIFLANGPDTLRLTGTDATVSDTITLSASGWSWVGYPLQDSQAINQVMNITPNTGGNLIRTVQQTGAGKLADYNSTEGKYLGNLTHLRPYDGYKIFNKNTETATLTYENTLTYDNSLVVPNAPYSRFADPLADRTDPTTWELTDYSFEFTMPFIATVNVANVMSEDTLDRVAIFNGTNLRGIGHITHVAVLDKYMLSLVVGDSAVDEQLSMYFYDASTDIIHTIDHTITFQEMGYGTFQEPYLIEIGSGKWYVEPNGSDGNAGGTWAGAFESIQKAIEAAAPKDTICVAAGTYLPTKDATGNASPANNRDKTFFFGKDLHIYGGFNVGDASLLQRDLSSNASILSGDFGGDDGRNFANNGENAYSVVITENVTTNFHINGFQISGGNSNANGGGTEADKNGGGWYNNGIGSPSNPTIVNCIFTENAAATGGAMASYGANGGQSNPVFINTIFHHNKASYDGGAIYNWGDNGEASPELTNCSFAVNIASSGGALFNNGNNSGISSPVINNCIFWGNTAPSGRSFFNSNANPQLSYSLIEESGCPTGKTCNFGINYNQDPLFADAANGDLHLQGLSPALDVGFNGAIPALISSDLDGDTRIVNGVVDLGAYEVLDCSQIMIRVWTGATNSNWEVSSNWDCGGTPTLDHNVLIPKGAPAAIIRNGITGSCKTIIVEEGAVLDLEIGGVLIMEKE
ncbi:MAG: hypothetical protein ACJA01_000100 [Saprospiraceae bacterium]|jgi:hypothetical protein